MAAESIIPAGLFASSDSKGFAPSPQIIMNGRVTKAYSDSVRYGFNEGDVLFSLSCLGNEYDAVLHSDILCPVFIGFRAGQKKIDKAFYEKGNLLVQKFRCRSY